MKKNKNKIIGVVLMVCGLLAVAVGIIAPIVIAETAERNGTLGIIGGADGPTYIYVRHTFGGGVLMALIALGVLAMASGVTVLVVDIVRRKRS